MKLNNSLVKIGFFALVLSLTSCGQAPESDTAVVNETAPLTEETAGGNDLAVNTEESKLTWIGTKPTGRHEGVFLLKSGSLKIEDGKVIGGTFVADINSLKLLDMPETDESYAKLTSHLKSGDFFDAEKFPEATFEITSLETYTPTAEAGMGGQEDKVEDLRIAEPTHTVSGNLTIKGETNNISFPARIVEENGVYSVRANFNIDRTKWGMVYKAEGSVPDKFIMNAVNIDVDLKTTKEVQ